MKMLRRCIGGPQKCAVPRTAAALLAASCTLLFALGVGVTASGAASWGPHNAGVSPHALTPSTVQHPTP